MGIFFLILVIGGIAFYSWLECLDVESDYLIKRIDDILSSNK